MTNAKFRILDISKTEFGFLQLGSRLKAVNECEEFENAILLPAGYSDPLFSKIGTKVLHENGFNEFRPSLSYLNNIIKSVSKKIKLFEPHIVHTHSSKGGLVGRIAARRADVPFVIHQVHGFGYKRLSGVKRYILEQLEKKLAKKCDLMLFQNKEDMETVARWNTKTRLLFISNGIDFSEFEVREMFLTPKECNIMEIAYVGRQDKNKNHMMAFKAIEQIGTKIDIKLHIFGNGPMANENKSYVAHSSILSDRVLFHGNIDREKLSDAMRAIHLNVLCSKQEGNPRTVMEASYLGIPTIGTNVVGTRESLIDGINGYLVPYNDHEEMARKILQFYEEPKLWADMSYSCREYARNNFDERKVIQKLLIIYKAILESEIDSLISQTNGGLNSNWF